MALSVLALAAPVRAQNYYVSVYEDWNGGYAIIATENYQMSWDAMITDIDAIPCHIAGLNCTAGPYQNLMTSGEMRAATRPQVYGFAANVNILGFAFIRADTQVVGPFSDGSYLVTVPGYGQGVFSTATVGQDVIDLAQDLANVGGWDLGAQYSLDGPCCAQVDGGYVSNNGGDAPGSPAYGP